MKSLDYTSLTQPVTKQDIASFKQNSGYKGLGISRTPVWIGSAFSLLFFGLALLIRPDENYQFLTIIWVFLAFIGTVFTVYAENSVRNLQSRIVLTKFAKANDAVYMFKPSGVLEDGLIFKRGHSKEMTHYMKFKSGWEMGSYEYTEGHGKSSTTYEWGFASMPLKRALPNMMLCSAGSKIYNALTTSGLTDSLSSDQKISLEGDFDKYFTLYAPKEYTTDALYLFTPDVMQAAVEHGAAFDMEIIGTRLYIYRQDNTELTKQKTLQDYVEIFDSFGKQLAEQDEHYADERVGNRALNQVAESGRELKRSVNLVGLFITLVIILIGLGFVIYSLYY